MGGPMGGMGGPDFFGGGDDFGAVDFFSGGIFGPADDYHDPYSHFHDYYDDAPDVVVTSGAAVAYSSASSSTMVLADGGNTISLNSTQLITNGTLLGGNGADIINMSGAGAIGTINLQGGTDSIQLAGSNTLTVSNTEQIAGGTGVDNLTFSGSGSTVIGGSQGTDNYVCSSNNAETFRYSALNQIGDIFQNFTTGTDKFIFSRSVFSGDANSNGALDSLQFGANVTSSSTGAYWVRDTVTHNLYYDADASGGGTGVLAANLDTTVAITDITFV